MNKLISIGIKIIGIYFLFLSAETIVALIRQYFENGVIDNFPISNLLLLSPLSKLLMYAIVGWLFIFRNQKVKSKFFKKSLDHQNEPNKIGDLSHYEILYLVFKLTGFLIVVHHGIIITCGLFMFVGYLQLNINLKAIAMTSAFIEFGHPLLKLALGIILFFFTDKLIKWIKE